MARNKAKTTIQESTETIKQRAREAQKKKLANPTEFKVTKTSLKRAIKLHEPSQWTTNYEPDTEVAVQALADIEQKWEERMHASKEWKKANALERKLTARDTETCRRVRQNIKTLLTRIELEGPTKSVIKAVAEFVGVDVSKVEAYKGA